MGKATCSVDGCDRPPRTRGYCVPHYHRWRRNGSAGPPEIKVKGVPNPPCPIAGCDRLIEVNGMCEKHNRRNRIHGDPNYVTPLTGQFNHCWQGDNIGIGAAHDRVLRQRGRAAQYPCVQCGEPARHWAYDHLDPDEKVAPFVKGRGKAGPYSVKPEHYQPMCVPCHKRFDLEVIAAKAEQRYCPQCNGPIRPGSPAAYCSERCRRWKTCEVCGKGFVWNHNEQHTCSRSCGQRLRAGKGLGSRRSHGLAGASNQQGPTTHYTSVA